MKSTWCLLLGFWPLLGSVADYFLTVIRQVDLTDWILDSFGIRVLQNNCGRPYSILHACLNVHSPLLLDHACVWKNTTPTWLYSMKSRLLYWSPTGEEGPGGWSLNAVLIAMGGGCYLKQGLWPVTVCCWSLSCQSLHSFVCVCETRSPGGRACLVLTEAVWLRCGSVTPATASVANTVSPPNPCRSPRMGRQGTAYRGAAALAVARCCPCPSAKACGATSTATCLTRACTLCGRVGGN